MPADPKSTRPDMALIVMFVLVLGSGAWVFERDGIAGVQRGLEITLITIVQVGPEMLLGIALAGMLQVLVSPGLVSKWMGEGSGLTGFAVGVVAGIVTPGGPYILFPIAASLVASGAGIGPLVAFVSVRNSANVNRLAVWEVPLLGVGFSVARILCSVPVAIAQVVLTPVVFRMMPESSRRKIHQHFGATPNNKRGGEA